MPSEAQYSRQLKDLTIQSPILQVVLVCFRFQSTIKQHNQNVIHQGLGAYRVLPEIMRPGFMSVEEFKNRAAECELNRSRRELLNIGLAS